MILVKVIFRLCQMKLYSKYFFWVVLFCLMFSVLAQAQEPFTRKISLQDGLPTQVIYDLYVSKNGFLYLATDKGLIVFDGVRYEIFPFKSTLAISINSIQEDENGNIWCKNFSNQVFSLVDGKLVENKIIKTILENYQENLVDYLVVQQETWLVTTQKVFKIKQDGSVKLMINLSSNDKDAMFTSVSMNFKTKKLYFTEITKIYTLDSNEKLQVIATPEGQKESTVFQNQFYYVLKGIKNEIYNEKNEKFDLKILPPNTYFINFSQTTQNLWLNSTRGVYQLDLSKQSMGKSILKGKKATDVVEDKEGNLWISTLDEGLYMIPDQKLQNVCLPEDYNIKVLSEGPSQSVFAGTNNGKVHQIDAHGVLHQTFVSGIDIEVENMLLFDEKLLTSIGIFDLNSHVFEHQYLGKNLVKDEYGNFVSALSTQAALFPQTFKGKPNIPSYFKKKTTIQNSAKRFDQYVFRSKRARSVHYSMLYKKYFFGFSDGLFYLDESGEMKEIKLPNGEVIVPTKIVEDKYGNIWVASSQQGLLKFKDISFLKQFNHENGLKSDFCRTISLEQDGLWLVVNDTIYFIDHQDQIKEIGFQYSLKGISIHDILIQNNKIWIATNEGVIFFPRNHVFQPYFSNFQIKNIEILGFKNDDITHTVAFNHKNITFQLNTNHYKSLGNYDIEYRLIGVDSQWRKQKSQINTVSYLSLAPGDYTFESRLRSGNVLSPIVTLPFEVQKPFWMHFWFLGLLVFVIVMLMYFVYKIAVKRTQQKQRLREQLALSQLTALRSQMNPHFMFNVLNAVQGLIYSNQKTKANQYLGAFSDLMRRTLDISDKTEVSIEHEINTIQLYIQLEKARFEESDFEYLIEKPSDIDLSAYFIPTLIVQPFVENAIKHGLMHKKGLKRLCLRIKNDSKGNWIFEIEDNGIGRVSSAKINAKIRKHKSFATQAIDNRIEIINKISPNPIKIEYEDLYGDFQQPIGTKITLVIPQKQQPYESHNH